MNASASDPVRLPPAASRTSRISRPPIARAVSAALLAASGLVAFSAAHAQTNTGSSNAISNSPISSTTPTFNAGPLKFTFGGFTAAESVWRSKDETADIGSNYNTLIPFAYQSQAHFDEFRESARQSRFALLVEGPHDAGWDAEYYLETDFLSAGVTSNSNESNSYTLRMRHFFGLLRNTNYNWYLLAGQDWSLATLSTSGTLAPRAEQVPLTIDAQYVVGFNWTRNAQLRFVKLFGKSAALGLSVESPQAQFAGGAAPATNITTEPGQGSGLLNATANYALDFAPDTIAKFAVNPGWGHFEIYGMERGFRDRYEPVKTSVGGTNNTTWGGSVGAGMILPFTKELSFQASGLWGNGIGRYGAGGLPDYAINPNGSIATIRGADVLLGLIYKPTSRLQLYAYGGEEQAQRTAAVTVGSTNYGYGNPNQNTSGCYLLTGTATTCAVNTQKLEQLILGEWWKAYVGPIGNFQIGLQYTYEDRLAFTGKGGAPSTNLNMGFVSFRYYPYQR